MIARTQKAAQCHSSEYLATQATSWIINSSGKLESEVQCLLPTMR